MYARGMRHASRLTLPTLLVGALATAACEPDVVCDAPNGPPAGLVQRGFAVLDEVNGHVGHAKELVLDGDLVYLADANGVPVVRTAASGAVTLEHGLGVGSEQSRCSAGAVHARSRTMVCGATDRFGLTLVDVSDPASPLPTLWSPPDSTACGGLGAVSDIAMSGDVAWLAARRGGLCRATLGDDGVPVELVATGIGQDVVSVIVRDGRIHLLDRALGLVVLDQRTLERLGSIALAGPPLDLDVQGGRAAVGLGSEGVQLYALAGGVPTPTVQVQPQCVVTSVALDGDRLAVGCLSGVYLYDLTKTPARLAGFEPSRFGILDVAFGPHGLLVSDWFRVDLFAADITGSPVLPDVPRAMRLQPGTDARIPIRNTSDVPLALEWSLESEDGRRVAVGTFEAPAAGETEVVMTASQLESVDSFSDRGAQLVVYPKGGAPSCGGTHTARTAVRFRKDTEDPANGFLAIGDHFPTLQRTGDGPTPEALPPPGVASLVTWIAIDCFLQWPQLEDMAWAQANGGRRQPVPLLFALTPSDEPTYDPKGWLELHGAANLLAVEWADYMSSVPGGRVGLNPVRTFETTFMISMPGADHPHDYVLDTNGTVRETSRLYRGGWPLVR